ncbi:MAG: DEAD/DEAH box helicase family protein [bacterium]|nr:DEAD/DEAH box helicase family protein [bacterium]
MASKLLTGPGPEIRFDRGSLSLNAPKDDVWAAELPYLTWDARAGLYRCHAQDYRELVRWFFKAQQPYQDHAADYNKLALKLQSPHQPHDFQLEAKAKWEQAKRGVCVLPTGSGKSFLAQIIMEQLGRSSLILAPTIDLILQWQKNLSEAFGIEVGLLGGGTFEVKDITVSTYDSARIHAERLGSRFCLLVFDECHHLPAPGMAEMARAFIAPYRLGLTATPVTEPERISLSNELTGPVVYQQQIDQLSGSHLAPYRVETLAVELKDDEREAYEHFRSIYLQFREGFNLLFRGNTNWSQFVMHAYRSPEGREALKAFRTQKDIAVAAQGKFEELARLLIKHKGSRILIFTNDNKTAYRISGLFLLPLITHETKAKERKEVLAKFKTGQWPVLVNSRVLNEGVDVPEAEIAVIVSGTATVREHVQRLGRILRKQEGKQALLYELITIGTTEVYASRKRRDHQAYARFT